jgi:cbb3-type cytochrome oxidase maturation protein
MYFPTWIMLVAISLFISLVAFVWGVSSGQFADQGRARYLPLRDAGAVDPEAHAAGRKPEAWVLAGILLVGMLTILASLALVLHHSFKG